MADYIWCHGPSCHTYMTQDRVRGSKGHKVIRTKKIAQRSTYIQNSVWSHFCSQGCWTDFMNEHWSRAIALGPRTECLETPINDLQKTRHTTSWGRDWYDTKIEVDNSRG